MRYGHKNALAPDDLATMHPALVGGGERAHAGLPPANALMGGMSPAAALASPPMPAGNALMGAAALSGTQPAGNALMAGAAPAPPPPPPRIPFAAQPVAASGPATRIRPKPAPAPKPLPGQEKAFAIAASLNLRQMSNAALSEEEHRFHWMLHAIGNLLAQPRFDHGDVARVVSDGVKAGIIPPDQVADLMSRITTNPTLLHKEMHDRYKFLMGALVQIAAERQRRAALGGKQ